MRGRPPNGMVSCAYRAAGTGANTQTVTACLNNLPHIFMF
jgi:hypothetical protein